MKVAIYTRVSTEDQAREGTSLEVQRDFLVSYAKKEGWEIYYPEPGKIYEDDGYSGYTTARPALKKLLSDAKKKRFDMVIVHKIDRFSRNLRDLLNLVEELELLNVSFKSATEVYDTSTSAGKMMFQQLGSFAEFERNRIKERVFPGMVKGVERGNWQGARYSPYGYSYNKLDPEKKLRVVKEEADVVKLIYMMYLSGQSTQQIAGYLYKKEYKTRSGGKFNTKLICDILKSQVYLGNLVWNEYHYDKKQRTLRGYKYVRNDPSKVIISKGRHEAIITQEDFDAVQRKLEQARKGIVKKCNSNDYPLTGIIYCPRCGNRFQGCINAASRENKKTKTKRRYYRCSARQTYDIPCDNCYARADELESEVYGIISAIFSHDIDDARLLNLVRNSSASDTGDIEQEIGEQKKKLEENLTKQEKLSKIYSEGLLAIEVYRKQVTPLRDEEKGIKSRIKKLEMSLIERERNEEYLRLIKDVVDHFETTDEKMDIISKKGLLKILFRYIKVDNGRIKDFELYEPYKSLYKGVPLKWEVQENQILMKERANVSTLLHTDAR
jgi:site-specific DNA recombinase